MKSVILVFSAMAIISLSACGQSKKEVPAKVKTAFTQKFPSATKVKWGMEDANEWEAEFTMNHKEYSANFDNTGNWLETEYEVALKEIPANVKSTLDKEFSGYKIKESELSETAKGKVYEFEIKKGDSSFEVAIDLTGKVVNKESMDEDDED